MRRLLVGGEQTLPIYVSICGSRTFSTKEEDNVGGARGDIIVSKKKPSITMCQLNNHPDFRLRQAKALLQKPRNAARPNDGTSSGALAEGRLRQARQKAMQNLAKPEPVQEITVKAETETASEDSSSVTEDGTTKIYSYENPVRSSDKTSSGAIAADRLRQARRKALQNLVKSESVQAATVKAESETDASSVREDGLAIYSYENPVRSSDKTSSGAIAADRLRQARMRVLQNMKKKQS